MKPSDEEPVIFLTENADINKRTKREVTNLFSEISEILENEEFVRFVEVKVNKSLENYISSFSLKTFCKETKSCDGETKGIAYSFYAEPYFL